MTNGPSDPEAPSPTIAPLLRVEGALLGIAAVVAYRHLGGTWGWYAALVLFPDLIMLGYLKSQALGAALYNSAHTYVTPALLVVLWYAWPELALLQLAALWTSHIGFDRMLGYGLKYRSAFRATHLQRV